MFARVYPLIQRSAGGANLQAPTHPTGESSATISGSTSGSTLASFISLDAHWDGVFPPRPPRPEDLVVMESPANNSPRPTGQPVLVCSAPSMEPPSGHGDWSTGSLGGPSTASLDDAGLAGGGGAGAAIAESHSGLLANTSADEVSAILHSDGTLANNNGNNEA